MKNFLLALVFMLIMCNFSSASANVTSVKLGDMEIFSLVDAQSNGAPTSLLIGATEEQLKKYVPEGKLKNQILAFLVKFPDNLILFDTGLGEAKGGKMMSTLNELGISASSIDAIFLTHLHGDHFGGLLNKDGEAVFTNAKIYVSRIEKDWWLNERKDENVKKALEAYSDRLNEFEFGDKLTPFITAIDASGHTPGHTVFHVKRDSGEILIVGDILHFAEIMLHVPQIAVAYDVDPEKAPKARKFILDMAADKNIPIAGMHFPVPGFWKIEKDGEGYKSISLEEK